MVFKRHSPRKVQNSRVPPMIHTSDEHPDFYHRASDIASRVRQAFTRLLASVPASTTDRRGRRTIPGLNPTLQSRLVRALEQHDPLATLLHLPGITALRSVLDEARRRESDPDLLMEARAVTDELADFIEQEGLDRETLQATLASDVPEARDAMVRTSSQMLYKSVANLKGYAAESTALIAAVYPDDNPSACSISMIGLIHGLRRFRADANHYERGYVPDSPDSPEMRNLIRTLDGTPVADLNGPPIIDALTDDPKPRFEEERTSLGIAWRHVGQDVGRNNTLSYAIGMTMCSAKPRYQYQDTDSAMMSTASILPSKRFVIDVLVHHDIWPEADPIVETHSIVPHGQVTESTRIHRQADMLNLGVEVSSLGRRSITFEHAAIAKHGRALDYLFSSSEQDPSMFRGYRIDMQYPLVGVQYALVFKLPK